MSNTAKPSEPRAPLALTPGEPAGIGPDLTLMLAARAHEVPLLAIADPELLRSRAAALGQSVDIRVLAPGESAVVVPAGVLQVQAVALARPAVAGLLDVANAPYVLRCLDLAADGCRSGAYAGMVTGPVQKSLINDAGIAFSGHTEYLAERLGCPLPVMMLVADTLRVALVTTHVALREVPALITRERLRATLDIVLHDLREHFGIARPRICVCGLNPHAGEGGHLGHEDQDEIAPVVGELAARGCQIVGPLPADTAFTAPNRARFDAIVAMYHDQGLAALKALGFGHAINVTLGLPIIRTSVDHGTALDLAGSGRADGGSLAAAVSLAAHMAQGARERS